MLSVWEILDFIPALFSIFLAAIHAGIDDLTAKRQRKARTLFLHIAYAAVRRSTQRLSPAQLQ